MYQVILYLLAAISPEQSAHIVSKVLDAPWLEKELLNTCYRESRCKPIGPHKRDKWSSKLMWRNARRVKWLKPKVCKHHRFRATKFWSPSGPWGASRAYTMRWLPLCMSPDDTDIPIINAFMVGRRMVDVVKKSKRRNRKAIRRAWKGAGNARKLESL